MNDSEEEVLHFDDKRLSLIDVSFEDDSLYSSPPRDFPSPHFLDNEAENSSVPQVSDAKNVQPPSATLEEGENQPESEEPEPRPKGKYNLRKSLAWDSAFFTSAGVLEPEELSSMMGSEKGGKQKLPGIEEDVHRSIDSISTLASDNLSLETLEADLFGDIRASIQKSSKASSGKAAPEIRESPTQSFDKPDSASRNKIAGVNGESMSLCKPPKATGAILTSGAKRASFGANRLKVERDTSKTSIGRGAKLPTVLPRPTLSSRSSFGSSLGTKGELTASSSVDSSGSLSSDNSRKSSLNPVRRKVDPRTGNRSSGSTAITAVRNDSRNKSQSTALRLSPSLKSLTKLSSSISPASSISEWSSESMSPTSTLNKRSNSTRSSFDTSSCRDTFEDGDTSQASSFQDHSDGKLSIGLGAPVVSLGECAKRVSTGCSSLLHPDSVKPTGLRMPSPKIGFFDGARSSVRTPTGSLKSHPAVPNGLHKSGAGTLSPSRRSNEAKNMKRQPIRTSTVLRNTKFVTQQPALGVKSKSPSPVQEPLNTVPKEASASRDEKCYSGASLKVQHRMSPASGGKHLKAEKVGSPKCNTTKVNPNVGDQTILSVLKDETYICSEDTDSVEGTEINCSRRLPDIAKSTSYSSENACLPQKACQDGLYSENCVKNDNYVSDTDKREKPSFADQVGSLTIQVGSLDIKREIQKETFGDLCPVFDINASGEVDTSMGEKLLNLSKPAQPFNLTAKPTTNEVEKTATSSDPAGIVGSS
ncbi:hypothetical protein Tsubulata_011549 [Turnera subulata]|uniref:Uncharacterized protein n=1 Tax=Turnera subulata TaxID=218843 RepID=A0A9Q0JHL9_9ROSI|nr:hypothetical protein Tsubulata_011549 [Turnera subulata]